MVEKPWKSVKKCEKVQRIQDYDSESWPGMVGLGMLEWLRHGERGYAQILSPQFPT